MGSDLKRVDAHVIKPEEYEELPELTDEMFARAVFKKAGRPRSVNPKQVSTKRRPMQDAPIELVPYSDAWPGLFASEAALLGATLKPWLVGDIQHIGSTAVPGLAAKPVIDIMAPVRGLEEALPAIEALRSLNYVHFPYKAAEMHWFCKPSPAHRTHHLHLVPAASELWHRRLAFRDALRREPALAAEYGQLKLRLAAAHANDRDAYTEAKTPFIQSVLATAFRSGA